ncbi:MAG: hypothetical protein JO184_07585 [Gammaproteobacteria bacterium]|nr:hypothetical protein [Gammaproteobacteria bacterium]
MKPHSLRLPTIVAAALSLVSCATEVPRQVAFNEATFTKVTLMPVNAYTTEIVQRSYAQQENLQEPDPRFQKYVRQVESDVSSQ